MKHVVKYERDSGTSRKTRGKAKMKLNKFKKIFCKHDHSLTFVKNLYGDMINYYSSGKTTVRSLWQCDNCKKIIRKSFLYNEENLEFKINR